MPLVVSGAILLGVTRSGSRAAIDVRRRATECLDHCAMSTSERRGIGHVTKDIFQHAPTNQLTSCINSVAEQS